MNENMEQQKSLFVVGALVIIAILAFLFLRQDEVKPANTNTTSPEALTPIPTIDAPIPTEETFNQTPQEPTPNP
jgi:hypothetical protein